MRTALPLLVMAASLLFAPVAMALSEYGIEGMGVVSTRANEGRASLSADGQRIVFASDRAGGSGGWDLWQARLIDGRWQAAEALPFNAAGDDLDPWLSRDGRWLLFASDRDGALALYRVAVADDGGYGTPERLPGATGTAPERGPAMSLDGRWLLFARHGSAQGWDLYAAPLANGQRGSAQALTALNTAADETSGDWLGTGGAVVFSRGSGGRAQVWHSACAWRSTPVQPLTLSFNLPEGTTSAPVVDASKPAELLVSSSSAGAPRAGGTDIYRLLAPLPAALPGCQPAMP